MISERCPAKINLSLDITGIRADGYHFVDMVMLSVSLCDTVSVELGGGEIEVECDVPALAGRDNICFKAAEAFFRAARIKPCGVKIKINKKIPVGAGLAGGSADAAGVLRGLNRLLGEPLGMESLAAAGASVGADVPFCVGGGCARARGIGELLTGAECGLKNPIVVAKPKFSVSTADVYREFDTLKEISHPETDAVLRAVKAGNAAELNCCAGNVLEAVTAAKHGEIGEYKAVMNECGALFSMMSGSGPSVFGIFARNEDASAAAEALSLRTDEVFVILADI